MSERNFYQRHLNMGVSPGDVLTFKRLRSSKGRYIYVNSVPGVLSVVQNGAVEFHTWGPRCLPPSTRTASPSTSTPILSCRGAR